jgi:hypothetical protein
VICSFWSRFWEKNEKSKKKVRELRELTRKKFTTNHLPAAQTRHVGQLAIFTTKAHGMRACEAGKGTEVSVRLDNAQKTPIL